MKAVITILVTLLAKSLTASEIETELTCKQRLLVYYGLEGLPIAEPYSATSGDMQGDYCPGLQNSCCSREDFVNSARWWKGHSENIKLYLSKIFRVLQRISAVQTSLTQLLPTISSKGSAACRKVDPTYFNSAVQFDELYFYLRNALEAFAFMQKGFYCMVCDAKQHKFLAIEKSYGRRLAIVSTKFCRNLMYFFREFLAYKVYFFDPMVINLNLALNCLDDSEVNYFRLEYDTFYQTINECLQNQIGCERLCQEFRFGSTSKLFIGKLSDYFIFLRKFENLLSRLSQKEAHYEEVDVGDESETYEEFFLNGVVADRDRVLRGFNVTRFDVIVANEGIDLFDIATRSNYFLVEQSNTLVAKQHLGFASVDLDDDGSIAPGLSTDGSTQTLVSSQTDNSEVEEAEFSSKLSDMEHNNEKPDSSDLSKFATDLPDLERQAAEDLQRVSNASTSSSVTASGTISSWLFSGKKSSS